MKVAITTILSKNNYGSVLQAYALYRFLSELVNEVVVIDYHPKEKYSFSRWLFRAVFIMRLEKRRKKLKNFIENNIRLTPLKYAFYSQLCKRPPIADVYITGSDQVWTDKLFSGGINPGFLLGFVSGKKKIAYATSTGGKIDASRITDKIIRYIRDFKYVSVRELTALQVLEKAGIRDIHLVMDPVFLINKKQYSEISASFKPCCRYLLIYSFEKNEKLNLLARLIAVNTGIKIIEIGAAFRKYESDYFYKDLGTEEFLGAIIGAEYVITTSFHGTALSIIMQKQFFSGIPGRGSDRVMNLLNLLGLEDRIISKKEDIRKSRTAAPIEYDQVEKLKSAAVIKSVEFLLKSLYDDYKGVEVED
jgi:hypothetical protein